MMIKIFKRPADLIIGPKHDPYMFRWWIIPKNPLFNIYLHKIVRSDDDRALHDHPWINMSILLKGSYIEHVPTAGNDPHIFGITKKARSAPAIVLRRPSSAHRLELMVDSATTHLPNNSDGTRRVEIFDLKPCWTLFITGPRVRKWGFLCPKGWRVYSEYAKIEDGHSVVGKGCDD